MTGYLRVLKGDAAEAENAIAHFPDEGKLVLIGHFCSREATDDGAAIDHLIAGCEVVHDHLEDGVAVWNVHLPGEDPVSAIVAQLTRKRWTTGKQLKIRKWDAPHQIGPMRKEMNLHCDHLIDGRLVKFLSQETDRGHHLRRG